jgi:hypothetical protein
MAQECPVCGQFYGITHTCPGAIPSATLAAEASWESPKGFSPLFYIREAIGVARFEDAAIKGAARDEVAMAYGAFFWLVSRLLVFSAPLVRIFRAALQGYTINWIGIILGIAVSVLIDAAVFCIQYGLAHSLARWWFGARGSFVEILRAMLMGSIVLWIYPVPWVGPLAGSLWMVAVLMRVFEEVDGIERLKAFGLSFGIGMTFWLVTLEILGARRP